MAHRPPAAALVLALSTAQALLGCSTPPSTPSAMATLRDLRHWFGTTQVALDGRLTYVLCEASRCPAITPKRTVSPLATALPKEASSTPGASPVPRSMDIAFGADSWAIDQATRQRLRLLCSSGLWSRIDLVGRSDTRGTTAARQRAAKRRASTLQRLVTRCAPNTEINITTQVATPPTSTSRARQRMGTVTFFPLPTRQ